MVDEILRRLAYHLRAAKGGSQVTNEAASERIGVGSATIAYSLRKADSTIGLKRFLDLCELYGVDAGEMLMKAMAEARAAKAS